MDDEFKNVMDASETSYPSAALMSHSQYNFHSESTLN